MKKSIIVLMLIQTTFAGSFSQITLEHEYGEGLCTSGKLSGGDFKYAISENSTTSTYIYNVNHTLYKSVPLTIPPEAIISSTYNLSDALFATDNLIEFTITYYVTDPVLDYTTLIFNEDGNILKTIQKCNYAYPVSAGTSGAKLICNLYDLGWVYSSVYSLPGQITAIIPDDPSLLPEKKNTLDAAYPNPASTNITLPYQLPGNINTATLEIYDMTGKMIMEYTVGKHFNSIELNTERLNKGTYSYIIRADEWSSGIMKFIVCD